ncbi:MAG: hypothetical protein PSX36_11170 [bacterium]|nr:hypothetical protein [bacterium]
MKPSFQNSLKKLSLIANQFDKVNSVTKFELLTQLSKRKLPTDTSLVNYNDLLMFLCAHPGNKQELALCETKLDRIAAFLKQKNLGLHSKFSGSGLPFSEFIGRFSHDIISWMLNQKDLHLKLDSFDEQGMNLNDLFRITLPTIEKDIADLGHTAIDLFKELGITENKKLEFIIDQVHKFNDRPFLKDYLFESLQAFIQIRSNTKQFSRPFNRFLVARLYFHKDLTKKFDHLKLLNTKVHAPKKLTEKEQTDLIASIRNSLLLMSRETDPATYMDPKSLRLYQLERGISVAIYGMIPKRQLPSESYIGYTLFKNGFPAAYGGAWIYGRRSLFGINIFEPFRGGESGYIMCQLLRVYRQVFHVDYFEVEPYQFGKDNPEGIASGAFWFYYRYGFRPVDKALRQLAEKEAKQIANQKGYRSSKQTLIKFTESNKCLNLSGKTVPASPGEVSTKVRKYINKVYKGNRTLAEKECTRIFIEKVGGMASMSTDEYATLKEMAFTAAALNVHSIHQLNILKQLVRAKPSDVYKYQELLLEFLEGKPE